MKLYLRQRILSWIDSYDIYDEEGETAFTVKGQIAWGHSFIILDAQKKCIAEIKERVLSWPKEFEMRIEDRPIGTLAKEFTLFKPKFTLDFKRWSVEGNFLEWDYSIKDVNGATVAEMSRDFYSFPDAYVIDIKKNDDVLFVLMVAVALDAEKCSR